MPTSSKKYNSGAANNQFGGRPRGELIQSAEAFAAFISGISPADLVGVDCETTGLDERESGAKLLGISLGARTAKSGQGGACYIVLNEYRSGTFISAPLPLIDAVRRFLAGLTNAAGANFLFDQDWIAAHLGVRVKFTFDTQIGWHHSDAPWKNRGYGLKNLQKQLLGWADSNEKPLHDSIRANGGDPKNGQFHLADLFVMAEYASLDAWATLLGAEALLPFFEKHNYRPFHDRTCRYRELLKEATREGLPVDVPRLTQWIMESELNLMSQANMFAAAVGPDAVREFEADLLDAVKATRSSAKGKARFDSPEHKPKLNLDSNVHLAKLFYEQLGLPVLEHTKAGAPAVHKVALSRMDHPAARLLVSRNELQKSLEYAHAYLSATGRDARMHPSFNVTGQISGRPSGFAPNVLQMPVGEESLMACFGPPSGRIGVGADLVSVEPHFTGYYSNDPTLLKVYRDRQGDIYLDLCLDLFPDLVELREAYNPTAAPSDDVKKRFGKERQIAKIVHLASAYGAGGPKIATILTQNGINTTADEGRRLHRLYWRKFRKVKEFEAALYEWHQGDGFVQNPFGRIIRLPEQFCKDLLSRFIQSTGHDANIEWIFRIDKLRKERGVDMRPLILDWYDATYWHCAPEDEARATQILYDALHAVNVDFDLLSAPLRCSAKVFNSLAGIK
jgi:DNA polymerase I-like protein with 3'-5' exonuclease and polymerase domains